MYSITPKLFYFFFAYEYENYTKFYGDFNSVEIIGVKCTPKKLFAKIVCNIVVLKRTNSNLSHFFYQLFCKQIFRIFLKVSKIIIKFCVVLIPIFKFCEEKVFRSYQHFFETLKPNKKEMTQNFENRVLLKCLRITFYTFIHTHEPLSLSEITS